MRSFGINTISIISPRSLLDTSITAITINDVQNLLHESCNCLVSLNQLGADVTIWLPDLSGVGNCPPTRFQKESKVSYSSYPGHDYQWTQSTTDGKINITLAADCWQGVSFGLYGLLQELLGFSFYHPREIIVPHLQSWPLRSPLEFKAKAWFDKKGFHLHTQHPLELTEQLHDPNLENALHDVKQYIDWLARNGQTYFEFCLLESIDKKVWPAHAKDIVDYAHSRGILAGVDFSLHMIQQKTFQLYKSFPKSFRKKKNQIFSNLQWLSQADWDFFNMEFSTAEFVGGNVEKKEKLRLEILKWLDENSGTKLMGRKHVVKDESEMMVKGKTWEMDSLQQALDEKRGILIHTVMFYSMTEPTAPVYENENLRHMYQLLLKEKGKRETWYYPESAYWITFDNSVPMLLLPYFSARLSDIDTCVKIGVPGHITFSSGWEWGYWMIDWSIARWSWQYEKNGSQMPREPLSIIRQLFGNPFSNLLQKQLDLQQQLLKDSLLIQWMTAMTVTDELPFGLDKQFGPRPDHSYKEIRRKISETEIDKIRNETLPLLDTFSARTQLISEEMENITEPDPRLSRLQREIIDALKITGLRAKHRFYTLSYLLKKREEEFKKENCNCESLLDTAAQIRAKALELVKRREANYRYPVRSIARRHWSHTAYHYGYLYPVSNLHFWEREELQAEKNKFKPLFDNIWDIGRIIGLRD